MKNLIKGLKKALEECDERRYIESMLIEIICFGAIAIICILGAIICYQIL